MEYLVVCIVAISVSFVTFFSGFGLGTVLMPAFAIFFPLPVAIAGTALVHLANNIFKVLLVGKHANWEAVGKFAVPGAFAALVGAFALNWFSHLPPLFTYRLGRYLYTITFLKLIIGSVIVAFACLELIPRFNNLAFDRKYLFYGGLLSGFVGGLSGNQGALRSAFLVKAGLDREAFVGTGTVSTIIVDVARLSVYGTGFYVSNINESGSLWRLIVAAIIAAFLGSLLGSKFLKKVTFKNIQITTGILLIIVGIGMAAGFF